jgi:hypothetical protein
MRGSPADVSSLGACLPSAMGACAPPLLGFRARGRGRVYGALQSLLRRRRSLPLSRPRSPFEVLGSSSYRPTRSTLNASPLRGKRLTRCPQFPTRAIAKPWRALASRSAGPRKFSHGHPHPVNNLRVPERRRPLVRANARPTPLSAIQYAKSASRATLRDRHRAEERRPRPSAIGSLKPASHARAPRRWTCASIGLIVRVCHFRSTRSCRAHRK